MNRILVVTNGESDLLRLLKKNCNVTVLAFEDVYVEEKDYDALCVLAGIEERPINPPSPLQTLMEQMRAKRKPLFCEFVGPVGKARLRGTVNTARKRMVYRAQGILADGLADGDLFDGQNNDCVKYAPVGEEQRPVLSYCEDICAHANAEITDEAHRQGQWALWWLDDTTLVSSIRMCNFRRARFAPAVKWKALLTAILSHLAGEKITPIFEEPVCRHIPCAVKSVDDVGESVEKGLAWIQNADLLKREGECGAREGFTNSIDALTGRHLKNNTVRADCTCEIGGALWFDGLLNGNESSKKKALNLFKFTFDWLQVKEGEHAGMLRWSEDAWDWCYQDDVARAVLPMLLSQHFGEEVPHFAEITATLDYMLETTGKDGIRIAASRTYEMTPEAIAWMKTAGSGEPCAHFNAYYHAVLLLAYKVCGKESYLQCAEKGLATIMSKYPDTRRETSETEECCRLVLPLAVLYGVTGKQEHYAWLDRVTKDLEKFRHECGGYAEWDTGYKAFCSRNHKGECALLANNGDPVADLLYSNNWLPLAFSYAYLVTKEERFFDLWASISSFLLLAQMQSDDPLLDGAWARAFDMSIYENNGVPYDIGWGPYCIESGWTVGEILMGLQFMKLAKTK